MKPTRTAASENPSDTATHTPPTLHDDGTATIGPILIGVWATLDGKYRLHPNDIWVKPFTVKGKAKFMKRIKDVYDV